MSKTGYVTKKVKEGRTVIRGDTKSEEAMLYFCIYIRI